MADLSETGGQQMERTVAIGHQDFSEWLIAAHISLTLPH